MASPLSDLLSQAITADRGRLPGQNTLLERKLNKPQPINLNPWTFPGWDASPVFLRNDPNVVPVHSVADAPLPPARPDSAQAVPLDQAPMPPARPVDTTSSTAPATGQAAGLPEGLVQYDVPGAGYRPGQGPVFTTGLLSKMFGRG